jgi:hypothetical protein
MKKTRREKSRDTVPLISSYNENSLVIRFFQEMCGGSKESSAGIFKQSIGARNRVGI